MNWHKHLQTAHGLAQSSGSSLLKNVWRYGASLLAEQLDDPVVVQIQCGVGGMMCACLEQGFAYTATDTSSQNLLLCGKKAEAYQNGVDNGSLVPEFFLSDLDRTPFPAQSFDVCVSLFNLHHSTPAMQEAHLKEMRRIAPYGLLMDYETPERNCAYVGCISAFAGESLSCPRAWKMFKQYWANEALEGILYGKRKEMRILQRGHLLYGAVGAAFFRWNT